MVCTLKIVVLHKEKFAVSIKINFPCAHKK